MSKPDTPPTRATDVTSDIAYMSKGPVSAITRDVARRMIERLSAMAPRPVIFSKVKVEVDEDRDPDEQAIVQGTMDISGSVIRAQAAAATPRDAVGAVGNRLQRRLDGLARRREDASERPPSTPPGTWRRGDLPADRPSFYPRPAEQRRVIRRKTYAPNREVSVSEALFDMDLLDYRFFLFRDESDGQISMVYEDDGGSFLRKVDGSSPSEEPRVAIEVNTTPAPVISVENAVEQLNMSDAPFIFFQEEDSQRASVVYRRYDGHYGLISTVVENNTMR